MKYNNQKVMMKRHDLSIILLVLCSLLSAFCSKKPNTAPQTVKTSPVKEIKYIDTLPVSTPLVHSGGLHTVQDFTRIKAKIAANAEPWISGWNRLIANSHAQASYVAAPVVKLVRGGRSAEEPDPDNYSRAFNDAAAAYQLALRWKISGESQYAQAGVNILNAWASTCERISGNSNTALAAGLYGYQFAVAAELLRDYEGWKQQDFAAYKQWMLKVFFNLNMAFLTSHWGTCDSHYWANWDLCNLASVMAIGILTDNRSMYNYAVNYLQRGRGNGNWFKAINYVFDGENSGLAQLQESGRDQGHSTLVIALLGTVCQLAWTQGDDFYGFDDNRFLKACEYSAKYNVARLNVPFQEYIRRWSSDCRTETYTQISESGRGIIRPIWSAPFYHYTKIKKLTARFTGLGVQSTFPEGGGGDYGSASGGYDQLGFGSLMYALD